MTDAVHDEEITAALVRLGLIEVGDQPLLEALTGGVSSYIYRVDTARGPICVKRARAQLAVEAHWEVDVSRNAHEYAWLQVAAGIAPTAVPDLLGRDDEMGLFAMAYLDPSTHPVWKVDLLDGRADPAVAAAVGALVGQIHAATADSAELAAQFATDDLFRDLRLDPYLTATAQKHPDLATSIDAIKQDTAHTRRVLVHGDVSPKNILLGPEGPVLLDAECAWFGDPAFDLAFCANHLVLKSFHRPDAAADLRSCFAAMLHAYLDHVTWESPAAVAQRIATLLPALLLARVDGTSPVEYLDDGARDAVRTTARALLADTDPTTLFALEGALFERPGGALRV